MFWSVCTCVIKPSTTTACIDELISETTFPAGAVNIALGESSEIGYIIAHLKIPRLFTMIDSTYAGMKFIENYNSGMKRSNSPC
ncbi:MAG TPA: hypothetical protein DC049_11680 [Spirochaetia bacterium]|nr:hypothetical protein [Spirochaetia bacterium]